MPRSSAPVCQQFAVDLVLLHEDDIRLIPLRALRTRAQVDKMLHEGRTLRVHLADDVGALRGFGT